MTANHSVQTEQQTIYRRIHDLYVQLCAGDRRIFKTHNVNNSQYAVLVLLDAKEGHRLSELSRRLLRPKSTITRIVDQLESAGFARRIDDPEDGRAQLVMLTPKGEILREKAYLTHYDSLKRRFDSLDQSEQKQLIRLMEKLRNGLSYDLESH